MHIPLKHLALAAVAGGALTFASCGDDDVIPVTPEQPNRAPVVSLRQASGADFDGSQDDLEVNTNYTLIVSATDEDGNLQFITFERNGTPVSGTSGLVRTLDASGNPVNLASPRPLTNEGSNYEQSYVFAAAQNPGETVTYTVIVGDSGMPALTDSLSFTLTTADVVISPDALVQSGTFFNRSGPNRGAFDLVAADSVPSSNNTMSQLQDAGNATTGNQQWRRVILAENGARILQINADDVDDFEFDDVTTEADVTRFAERATGPASGDTQTEALEDGDVFVVVTDERFYLVRTTRVVNTTGDNLDRYEIDYKSAPRT